jgi:LEA14-like dessication related protein
MTTSSLERVLLAVLAAGLTSCASMKTPVLQVEGLHFDKVRVTGAGFNVNFRVQNPNPEALVIERFEYELKLNGRRLGRGYHTEAIRLDGFKDERLQSRFALNFLSVPGAVREVLDDNNANVEVKGDFYVVRESGGLKKMGFKNNAKVNVGQ